MRLLREVCRRGAAGGGRHPRRAAGVVGRPGRVPPRRPPRRPDRRRRRARVAARHRRRRARRERARRARRAAPCVRWAWRLFRREWRQQLLVLALITVAVAAAVAGVGDRRERRRRTAAATFGDADAMVRVDGTDPADAQATRAPRPSPLRHRRGDRPHAASPCPARSSASTCAARTRTAPFGHPMLALRARALPDGAGEVALTAGAADAARRPTSATRSSSPASAAPSSASSRTPSDLDDEFALRRPPADDRSRRLLAVLVGPTGGSRPTGRAAAGATARPPASAVDGHRRRHTAAVAARARGDRRWRWRSSACIAAAGFVVVAQRRQRQLGLLAAIGADRPPPAARAAGQRRASSGSSPRPSGGVLGVVGWVAAAPAVERAAGHRIDRFDLPVGADRGRASSWPSSSRPPPRGGRRAPWPAMPVMAALSRRPSAAAPVHRSLALAAVLVAAGVVGHRRSRADRRHVRPLLLIAGMRGRGGRAWCSPRRRRSACWRRPPGAAAASPPVSPCATWCATRPAPPPRWRRSRSALGISVAVVVLAEANEYTSDQGNLSDRQLVLRLGDVTDVRARESGGQATTAQLDAAAVDVVEPLGGADGPPPRRGDQPDGHGETAASTSPSRSATPIDHGFRNPRPAYVATPELLARCSASTRPRSMPAPTCSRRGRTGCVLFDEADPVREGAAAPTSCASTCRPTRRPANSLITDRPWTATGGPHDAGVAASRRRSRSPSRSCPQHPVAAADAGLAVEIPLGPGRPGRPADGSDHRRRPPRPGHRGHDHRPDPQRGSAATCAPSPPPAPGPDPPGPHGQHRGCAGAARRRS